MAVVPDRPVVRVLWISATTEEPFFLHCDYNPYYGPITNERKEVGKNR